MHPVLFSIGPVIIPAYGALAALGELLALMLAQRSARIAAIDPNKIWNLCIIALFTALAGSRILLVILNWNVVRSRPLWVFGLAMIHHPMLSAAGAIIAVIVAALYARSQKLPIRATADVLAAPVALGLAFEQFGALMAGSGYGTGTTTRWAVVYTNPLAARWSGAPLGIPVHPVQAYAALAFLTIAVFLLIWLPNRSQQGDLAGLCLMSTGVVVYVTEFWRDPIGRGTLFRGVLKGPQAAGIVLVVAGALVLLEQKPWRIANPPAAAAENAPSEATRG